MHTHAHTAGLSCPECRYVFECSSNMNGERTPAPGDFTICIRCGQTLRFNAEMNVERVNFHQMPPLVAHQMLFLRRAILARKAARN